MDVDDNGADNNLADRAQLSEACLVDAIESRFRRNLVYTHAGSILLAVNPFRAIDGLYGEHVLRAYESPNPVPHIYGVAAEAYRALTQRQHRSPSNQTILISGDSGSGKTESTKRILDYFMHVGRSSSPSSDVASSKHLARHVVAANRVLEAFGHAQTLRNDNSSRFGKFIQLEFSAPHLGHALVSASLQTYLLETVRIVSPAPGERNYHVFYALLSGADSAALSTWRLLPPSSPNSQESSGRRATAINSYRYLGQRAPDTGPSTQRRHDDRALYTSLLSALTSLDIPSHDVFRIVAVVLHLGNICFDQMEGPKAGGGPSRAMADAAELLHVPLPDLRAALTTRTLVVAAEVQVIPLSPLEARQARDGLAKALYARLFDWLVDHMNARLNMAPPPPLSSWIGVLDIFGFEQFTVNSFEQLCINFTNEVLHQQFVEHVFKMEQTEYAAEGLNWTPLPFQDNADCVALFSAKHTGLFALLDEESLLAQGSDAAFASKLTRERGGHPRFAASYGQQSQRKFTIHHFAGPVEYTAMGFRDKNAGVLAHDVVGLLQGAASGDPFVRQLFRPDSLSFVRPLPSLASSLHKKPRRHESVASQFQTQLGALMKRLHATDLHYVRCVKANDAADPALVDTARLLEQLRCHGVVDAIRISRLGFPVRLTHAAFWCRYSPVVDRAFRGSASLQDLVRALTQFYAHECSAPASDHQPVVDTTSHRQPYQQDRQLFQVGATKVFMHAAAHGFLEDHRARIEHHTARVLVHAARGFLARCCYLRLRTTVLWCQHLVRRNQARRRWHDHAARLQALVRVWLAARRRERLITQHTAAATAIQSVVRMVQRRRSFNEKRRRLGVLQRWWVRWLHRRREMDGWTQNALPSPLRPGSIVRSSWAADSELCAGSDGMNDVIWRPSSVPLLSPEAEISRPRVLHRHDVPTSPMTSPRRIAPVLPPLTLVDPATLPPLDDSFSCLACSKRFKLLYRRRYCCLSCRHVVCGSCSNVVGEMAGKKARVCLVCAALHQGATDSDTAPRFHAAMGVWHRPWPEPPMPSSEMSRLAAVAQLDLGDLRHDVMIQHICTMVYHTWPGAVAFVGIMDQTKQIMLTSVGCSMFPTQLARDVSLCAHTVCGTRPLVVMDATKDPRFMYNPLVKGGRHTKKFSFYMGAQVIDDETRHVLGTIAVLHTTPRKTRVQQCELQVLENFASVVSHQLTMSKYGRPRESSFI